MTDRTKIFAIYATVAVLSVLILGTGIYVGNRIPDQPQPDFTAIGAEKAEIFFPITRDLMGETQQGQPVALSDLKGKVWLVAEFFAVCPHCAVRNGQELREIFEEFKDHPDFHIVCITVDPSTDTTERLAEYAKALGADPQRWWFFRHPEEKSTHDYMEKTLGFFGIRERKDPADIEANGRFAHDLGIAMIDREWNVIGKWPLADARSEEGRKRDPQLYESLKEELRQRLSSELEKNETAGTESIPEDPAPSVSPDDE